MNDLTRGRRLAWRVASGLALMVLGGCFGSNAASVSGLVTLDGKALASGNVSFYPESKEGAPAYGQIDAQGRYTLSTGTDAGLMPGNYTAAVVATKEPPMATDAQGVEIAPIPITPTKYGDVTTSDLKAVVKAGRNEIPLALESRVGGK